MTVLPTGIWTQDTADATHQSSPVLAAFLAGYLPKDQPVIDFGCGNAYYLGQLSQQGFATIGYEGYPLNNFQAPLVHVADLTQPIDAGVRGSVISLEVGEHLPASAQETFMHTVTSHCLRHLIFSWAEVGQPGLGHINCRHQADVIADVCRRGFFYKKELTHSVRRTIEEHCSWFQRTLLIFERTEALHENL